MKLFPRLLTVVCVLLLGAMWTFIEFNKLALKAVDLGARNRRAEVEFQFKVFQAARAAGIPLPTPPPTPSPTPATLQVL